jgi:uncharacterized membrane protein YfbV (UPF0208 family)
MASFRRAEGQTATQADPTIAAFYRGAAKRWREMAAQLELLEQEPAYRIIHSQCRE